MYEVIIDEWGEWHVAKNSDGEVTSKLLVTPSQKWRDENQPDVSVPQLPTFEEKLETLEQEKLVLQLALAESIEKQEIDKINNQLALAELVETLTMKGVL
ncbi:hypothetical protein [Cytobacillus solani]|uniref:Bacteriophage SP-beta YorD domain-containing protein n=1 Tax=Cytobacillus solani TaxID=1637975 RepID=A0A0Q3SEL2_9BACI